MKILLLLIGINGAGKSTTARLLSEKYPNCLIDSEERAFNRKYIGKADSNTHESIVADAKDLIQNWKCSEKDIIIVDRWYETYITDCELPLSHVAEIELYAKKTGFHGHIINLLMTDDYETLLQRLTHTKNQRDPDWWDPNNGSLEERTKRDMQCQKKNRDLRKTSQFIYSEVDTTDMNWSRVLQEVESILEKTNS